MNVCVHVYTRDVHFYVCEDVYSGVVRMYGWGGGECVVWSVVAWVNFVISGHIG